MPNVELIEAKGFYYKMGVLCGNNLYNVYKFDSFEKMMQEAEGIDKKYKGDMRYCRFCFQAFKDDSYDFQKSCFSQIEEPVNGISRSKENIARIMLQNYEMKGGE